MCIHMGFVLIFFYYTVRVMAVGTYGSQLSCGGQGERHGTSFKKFLCPGGDSLVWRGGESDLN